MKIWREILGFIWWTHPRGSLRYDIMVALILAFIFATPRSWFDDRPPRVQAGQIQQQPDGSYRVDARLLGSESNNITDTAARLLENHTGSGVKVVRWEVRGGSEGKPEVYYVWIER